MDAELDLFRQKLFMVLREHSSQLDYEITGSMSMRGDRYARNLMVVGRALNGGDSCITPTADIDNQDVCDKFTSKTWEDAKIDGCPQHRIERGSYRISRSAFWRTTRAVVGNLRISDINGVDWSSYLVYSNLYKLSPQGGGNPSGLLRSAQQSACVEMLALELCIYKPRRLLFLTGDNWFGPFRGALGTTTPIKSGRPLSYVQEIGDAYPLRNLRCRYVVASHPQGKPECPIVNEILHAFSA